MRGPSLTKYPSVMRPVLGCGKDALVRVLITVNSYLSPFGTFAPSEILESRNLLTRIAGWKVEVIVPTPYNRLNAVRKGGRPLCPHTCYRLSGCMIHQVASPIYSLFRCLQYPRRAVDSECRAMQSGSCPIALKYITIAHYPTIGRNAPLRLWAGSVPLWSFLLSRDPAMVFPVCVCPSVPHR